jgi:hypothetical protein
LVGDIGSKKKHMVVLVRLLISHKDASARFFCFRKQLGLKGAMSSSSKLSELWEVRGSRLWPAWLLAALKISVKVV